jgi:predicted DNA-binding protein
MLTKQLNVRLSKDTLKELVRSAEKVGSTPSQIVREAILKELEKRKKGGNG